MDLFSERRILTVSQLTALIRGVVEENFEQVWVQGEISNLALPQSGHAYFTLKDSGAQLRCVMFRAAARALRFRLQDGIGLIARGRLTVYDQRGDYQLVVEYLEPQGLGALQLAFQQRGDLPADLTMVISNHDDLRGSVEGFGVPFHHVPNSKERRGEAEARMLALLEGKADLVVLARYMQIVSPGFVARFPNRIINIHHSFLPAFAGADPYRQAYDRGVKIVGATAHYVTSELDAGPIIEQDVGRVTHRDSVEDLKRIGRDLERRVLARAVRWHCEDRVLVHGNKTVVFS